MASIVCPPWEEEVPRVVVEDFLLALVGEVSA
jgi:hypothetical protein